MIGSDFMYTVLLVDDEPAIIKMVKRAIINRTVNFEVIGEAYSVKKAKTIYNELKPDVILTDIKMPEEEGTSLIHYITQTPNNTSVCVAISGYSDFNYVHDSFVYDAFDYLLKPVEPNKIEELFNKIKITLDARESLKPKFKPKADMEVTKTSGEKLVEEIEIYIKDNLSSDTSIAFICRYFSISQPYLSKIFKKYKDSTYNEFVINLKINEAKHLLQYRYDYLIGDIAISIGFSDQFYFSKVFKNIVGCTPSEYRFKQCEL